MKVFPLLGILALSLFPSVNTVAAAGEPYRDPARPVDERVRDLLGRMSLEEKIDQLTQKGADHIEMQDGTADEASLQKLFGDRSIGVLCVKFGDDLFESARRLSAGQKYLREKTRLGIPALTVNEGLHGVLARGATIYPQFIALGCTWNPQLAERMGAQISREATAAGVNHLLTPMVEVIRDPRWGRVEECIGESPFLVARMCSAYTLGIQGDLRTNGLAPDKALAMLKTFAGYSAPVNGINIGPCILGERELRTYYLPPVEAVIRETGVLSVMPSYNEVDGVPSHANRWLLEDVLRGEMGFRGYTYSDWGGVIMNFNLHHVAGSQAEAGAMALTAGVDLEAPGPACFSHLAGLVQAGRLPESEIDKAASRVLRVKFLAGLFDGRPDAALEDLPKIARCADHVALSRQIAEESIVLLKNDHGLLPLDPAKIKSLAVVGPNADQVQFGDYCWSKNNRDGVTVLRGLRERLGDKAVIHYAKGCDLAGQATNGFAAAVEAAKKSDVAVVVLGDTSMILSGVGWEDPTLPASGTVGEGYDVTDPAPPGVQEDLVRAVLAAGKPVVVVFLNGRPYSVAVDETAGTGDRRGILSRRAAGLRRGRRPARPRESIGPPFHDRPPERRPYSHGPRLQAERRGYYHQPGSPEKLGRDYVFSSPDPLWAFGFGLSYTTFEYAALKVETPAIGTDAAAKVSFVVKNTGGRAGKEVAQVYIRDEVSSVTTPVMRLAGFEKIELPPGESRTVTVTIPPSELSLWNVAMKRVVEPGWFSVLVGASAADIRLRGRFEVVVGEQAHD